ncbi:efflux RND transporter permease subunit [Pseudaquidulcibacter saccharophilus]|uniref:efflux RND transporter permease subunit n=1 Tax=Pseudaquidulcibacter saccharophilus TaxID=2831900 RepID=UPI001EFEF62D|nr:efflux RND transporter permease subunit [Pseudaquidulcibacter saccharophilus]
MMQDDNKTEDKKTNLGIAGALTKATINSPLTLLMLLAAFAVGIMALLAIPREEEPQISVPMVTVQIPAPGLSAYDIERKVTDPVETSLRGLDGVEHVYSQTQDNGVMLTARFYVGTKRDDAILRVQQKMREPNVLPKSGTMDPIITARGIDDVPIVVVTLSPEKAVADRWSDAALYDLAVDVQAELTQVKDIGTTFLVGGRPNEVRITPNPAKLKSYGVPLGSLIETLKSGASSMPLGTIRQGGVSRDVIAGREFSSVEDVKKLVVRSISGSQVFVQDVADVTLAPRNDQSAAYHYERDDNGNFYKTPTVAIAIAKRPGVNAVVLTKAVHTKLESLQGNLIPTGIRADVVRDYGATANEKANELLFHLGLATISIVALIFFTIGRRESFVTLVVIPTTILLTMFASNSMGYTINRVSLFALIFSIGILVDDAIVMIENIARHWSMSPNRPKTETAIEAVAEVGNPTIVATLTVVVALLPMMFVSGLMGPYMAPIPANASAAMLFSFFVAVIIAPWLMVKFAPKNGPLHAHNDHDEGVLGRIYRKVATPIIATKKSAWTFLLAVGVATILACVLFYTKTVTVKLLPFDNKSEFQVVADLPEGTSLETTQRVLIEAADKLGTIKEVESMEIYAGTSAPFNFNGLVRHYFMRDRAEMGDLQVNLSEKSHRKRASHEIALEARKLIGGIQIPQGGSLKVVEVPPGPPVISTLLAEIYGPDQQTRRAVADEVKKLMAKIPYVVDIDDYYGVPRPNTLLVPNREQMDYLGVNEGMVLQSIGATLSGTEVGTLQRDGNRDPLSINVRLPTEDRSWSGILSSMPVAMVQTPTGGRLVDLGEVVNAKETKASYPIFRRDGHEAEMVTADLAGQYEAPIYGIFDTNNAIKNHDWGNLPKPNISWHGQPSVESTPTLLWDGEWEITYVTFRDMGAAFGVAIIGIYILVVAQFKSFKLPLVVLTPIPLTLIGIVLGHALFGAPFSATSMIGFIALAGIIVRNSILLIDFIRNASDEHRPLREVLLEAGAIRFKPILLTAVAAMIGAAVILTDPIFQGLAISLLFGLMSSTLLTVLVIPAIYVALRDDGKGMNTKA